MKEFRKKYPLTRVGGKKHLLSALLATYKQFKGRGKPRIAILEFRPSFATTTSEFELFRDFFRQEGYEAEMVSPDQLEFKNDVLRRGNFEIDLVYRRVSVQEFLQRFDLSHPLVQAYRARKVCIANSFRSELAHKKAMFALLTDEEVTAKFPAAERKAIRDHVPWTRLVSTVKTTYHGKKIDLPEYILKHRERLVLKPNDDYTGQGSFFGWEMNDASWDRALRQAVRLPYVVQEKIEPAKSVFPVLSDAGARVSGYARRCVSAGLSGADIELLELAVGGKYDGVCVVGGAGSYVYYGRGEVEGAAGSSRRSRKWR